MILNGTHIDGLSFLSGGQCQLTNLARAKLLRLPTEPGMTALLRIGHNCPLTLKSLSDRQDEKGAVMWIEISGKEQTDSDVATRSRA